MPWDRRSQTELRGPSDHHEAPSIRPPWLEHVSPWGTPWAELVERPGWFARFPSQPPLGAASLLGERVLRADPAVVPEVLWGEAGLLESELAQRLVAGRESHAARLAAVEPERAREALETGDDLDALLSPAADALRADLWARAEARAPGRVRLYAPLYLSNLCTNQCTYCGFRLSNDIPRVSLGLDAIHAEAQALAATGIRHVLLVTGESPAVGLEQVLDAVKIARERFETVSVEIFPCDAEGYRRLATAGVAAVTLYQETYDLPTYLEVHPAGRKRNFLWRLGAPERIAAGGIPAAGLGFLLGLGDWRFEAAALLTHARWLTARHPQLRLRISFPRLRPAEGGFTPRRPVSDEALVHLMSVCRLVLPDAELVLSTREPAALRDHLAPRLVHQMSAGSRTDPGGYGSEAPGGAQFALEDHRSPAEVAAKLEAQGVSVTGWSPVSGS